MFLIGKAHVHKRTFNNNKSVVFIFLEVYHAYGDAYGFARVSIFIVKFAVMTNYKYLIVISVWIS